jgi:hypothetical protein
LSLRRTTDDDGRDDGCCTGAKIHGGLTGNFLLGLSSAAP